MSEPITPTAPVMLHMPPDRIEPFLVWTLPGITLNGSGFVCGRCASQVPLIESQRPHPHSGYVQCPTCEWTHAWSGGAYYGIFNSAGRSYYAMSEDFFPPGTGAPAADVDYAWTGHDAYGWTEAERHAAGESFYPQAQIIPKGGYSRGIGPDWDETENAYEGFLYAAMVGGIAGPAWQLEIAPE